MTVGIGAIAPDFVLKDQDKNEVRLSDFRGQKVLLMFYPYAFSGICTPEVCEVRDRRAELLPDDTQALWVSVDSVHALRAFKAAEEIPFPLLSDFWPHGEVARRYGVFNEEAGAALRGTFVIDREGVIRWSVVNAIGEARSADDYVKALAELG